LPPAAAGAARAEDDGEDADADADDDETMNSAAYSVCRCSMSRSTSSEPQTRALSSRHVKSDSQATGTTAARPEKERGQNERVDGWDRMTNTRRMRVEKDGCMY
jgi:hypothetical protein